MSSAAAAPSFTNHAGRVVSGELVAVTNGVAVIGSRSIPLSVFPESEQERLRSAGAGACVATAPTPSACGGATAGAPSLRRGAVAPSLRRSLEERARRTEALLAAGAISEEEAAAKRARLESIWARALREQRREEK